MLHSARAMLRPAAAAARTHARLQLQLQPMARAGLPSSLLAACAAPRPVCSWQQRSMHSVAARPFVTSFSLSRTDNSRASSSLLHSSLSRSVASLPGASPARHLSVPGFPGGPGGPSGPGGPRPIPAWKVLAVIGGVAVTAVSGLALIAGALGPWFLGGIAAWLTLRSLRRWYANWTAAGGASNPANPFRRGPWTAEARVAAKVFEQQQRMASLFDQLPPGMRALFAAAQQRAGGAGGAGMGGFAEGGLSTPVPGTPGAFWARKMRATLLRQAMRHPALNSLHGGRVTTHGLHPRSVQASLREVSRTSGGGVEYHYDEALDLGPHMGLLTGRVHLRLSSADVASLAAEMRSWLESEAESMREAAAASSRPGQAAALHSTPDPAPFSGALYRSSIVFEQATFTPRARGAPTFDLTHEEEFTRPPKSTEFDDTSSTSAMEQEGVVKEAEYEEISPKRK